MFKEWKKTCKEKIYKCVDTLLGQSNLCSCSEKSPINCLNKKT